MCGPIRDDSSDSRNPYKRNFRQPFSVVTKMAFVVVGMLIGLVILGFFIRPG